MKHIRDAKKLVDLGNGPAALEILDNLLELAPRNTEALRLKAQILDHWGHFDISFDLLKRISTLEGPNSTILEDYEDRLQEEREAMVFSEITPEGRWYFAFPRTQMWISLYGFLGCAAFLLMSSNWSSRSSESLPQLLVAFFMLVLVPWVALIVIHLRGIKKILIGVEGIKICTPFSSRVHRWSEISAAAIEYDPNVQTSHLVLKIFGKSNLKEPLETFDVSKNASVVRARRHFVRNILAYIDCVSYLARPDSEFSPPFETTENAISSENKAA